LNGVGPIKEQTRRKVLEAAEQLNYHPSAIAQSFAKGRSGNLGVVLPHVPKVHLFSTYYFSEILSGIGATAADKGYDLLLKFHSPESDSDYSALFRRQKVDACIILGSRHTDKETASLRKLQAAGLPFCLVNQHFAGETFCEIDAEHEEGSYHAVKHLIEGGYRTIAFLNGSPEYSNSLDRLNGYRRALKAAGIPFDPSLLFEGNYSRTSGYRSAPSIARHEPRIDAVFAANDRMAIGLMQGLREAGVRPGRDIAIIGCDDSDAARFSDPLLSSVKVPFYEMGCLAAEKLLSLIDAPEESAVFQDKVQTQLVIRQSCKVKP
jgi:LacI family transcriptional regulator